MAARSLYDGPANDEIVEDTVFVYGKLPKGTPNMPAGGHGFKRVHYTKAVCGDCDAAYNAETWWWDEDSSGDPMLVCACGGQLYSTCED